MTVLIEWNLGLMCVYEDMIWIMGVNTPGQFGDTGATREPSPE